METIYRLNNYLLSQKPDEPVVVLDWGIHYNLVALSQGRLQSMEFWPALNDLGANTDALQDSFKHRNYRYVLHEPPATNFPLPRERFFEAVAHAGLAAKLQHTFPSRDGQPILDVYTVEPGGSPPNAPKAEGIPASITAAPNPVRSEAGKLGTTKIMWSTGNGLWSQVYVSENGRPETLFMQGEQGSADAAWIGEGEYEFRLYAGNEHQNLLASVKVRGKK
jgi:hypothetical protein